MWIGRLLNWMKAFGIRLTIRRGKHSLVWEDGWHEGGGAVRWVNRCRCGTQGTDPRIWDCVRAVESGSVA